MTGLQVAWFVIAAGLVAVYAILDGFDLGIGVLGPALARTAGQRAMLHRTVGPVWDGNEVWLIIIGGVMFAAFPPVYATVLSGFYLVFMLVFFGLIFRATALGLHYGRSLDAPAWRAAFWGGSLIPAFFLGLVAGNLIRGVQLSSTGDFAGSLGSLFGPFAVATAILSLAMFANQGAAWATLKTTGELHTRAAKVRRATGWVLLLLLALVTLYALWAASAHVSDLVRRPLGWVAVALAVCGILYQQVASWRSDDRGAFVGASVAVMGLVAIWAVGTFPAIVRASNDEGLSLTVAGASASSSTLRAMTVVAAIGIPVVAACALFAYRVFRGRVDKTGEGY